VIFEPLDLAGAFLVLPEPIEDDRGAFARLYCAQTFANQGLEPRLDQISLSFNRRAGTLRGLHLQRPPFAETKLIRVTAGAIWDVIVDVRAGSATFGQWRSVELSAANRRQLYVPAGFAHGFQSLTDGAEITYHISVPYRAEAQGGVRWDDPDLAIAWPSPQTAILSDRDRALPPLSAFKPVEAPC
jgi:dTDP-4-dehydrorhamnose 3,5-epimerase